MKLLAHIVEKNGKIYEQSLREHCLRTAEYAGGSLSAAGLSDIAYAAGALHDMGKARQEYVDYLLAAFRGENVRRGSVNHTYAAVIYLLEKYHTKDAGIWDRITCEIIGYAVGSHHGMFDCVDLDDRNGFAIRLDKDRGELDYKGVLERFFAQVISEEELDERFRRAALAVQDFWSKTKAVYGNNAAEISFQTGMLARLVSSAVMYGDRRDTGEFMAQQEKRKASEPAWEEYRRYLEEKMAGFRQDSELNRVRSEISEQCAAAAERPGGIYRLNLPTGAGKTLCSLRYALAHAEEYHKKRIVFIIPLLGVLDQNVRVIREYVPETCAVTECHSNVVRERDKEQGQEAVDRFELAAEDWNEAPIVVSTLVQFLNILFSAQTTCAARLQALCGSVIVLDEVQSLPKKTTVMFNRALNFLRHCCNATIILSSATQPCFDELKWPLHLSAEPDIVQLSERQQSVFRRAQIIDRTTPSGMDMEGLEEFCRELAGRYASLLVICNTKAEARELYERLQNADAAAAEECYHLSTSMCQAHRVDQLQSIQEKLKAVQREVREHRQEHRLICVSTQLIEAGIDLSFACVVRVLAGIDNLAQAAGRCNRSNEYGASGAVYLVNLKDEKLTMLHEIVNAQHSTIRVLEEMKDRGNESCTGEAATRLFYRHLYAETASEIRYPVREYGETFYLADLLSNQRHRADKNGDFFLRQPYKTVGNLFRVFDQDTMDVLAPYGEGREIAEELREMQNAPFALSRCAGILKRAKPYMISVYDWQRVKLEEAGLLSWLFDRRIAILSEQAYHADCGLDSAAGQSVENYIL